jgi:hypothetical protein
LISYLSDFAADSTISRDLKVAHCADVVCSSATVTSYEVPSMVMDQTAIAIGPDGFGTIAYWVIDADPSVDATLKVAHCRNAACTTATITAIDPSAGHPGNAGPGSVSIASSPRGYTYISYHEHGHLNVATCTTADCAGHSVYTVGESTVSGGLTGRSSSIAVGRDGLPLISYEDRGPVRSA